MTYPTGTILTRREKLGDALDEVKVVGTGDQSMSVQSNLEFGAVFPLSGEKARAEYTTDVPEGSGILAVPGYTDPGLTPEEVFAAEQRTTPPKPDTGRQAVRKQQKVKPEKAEPVPPVTASEQVVTS